MERSELLLKLTGRENPTSLTERELIMIDEFMKILEENKNTNVTEDQIVKYLVDLDYSKRRYFFLDFCMLKSNTFLSSRKISFRNN